MRIKILIASIGLLFFVDSFSQNTVLKNSAAPASNPFYFCAPSPYSSYEDVLAFLSNRPKFKILETNGRMIGFSYDGGIDWLAGSPGNDYQTWLQFENNRLTGIYQLTTKQVDGKICAAYAKKYFAECYGLEPECKYENYKLTRGAEIYKYIWDLNGFRISVVIRDWNNSWSNYDIYVTNKRL